MEGYKYSPRKLGKYDIMPLVIIVFFIAIPLLLFLDLLGLIHNMTHDQAYMNPLYFIARLFLIPGLTILVNRDLFSDKLYISKWLSRI